MGTARVAAAVEEDGRLGARARDRALRGPHDYEVYHAFELNLPAYPGEEQVAALAGRGCLDEFAGFVGVPYDRSVLEPYVLYPQERTWTLLEDREVTCLLGEPGRTSVGTLAGSGR